MIKIDSSQNKQTHLNCTLSDRTHNYCILNGIEILEDSKEENKKSKHYLNSLVNSNYCNLNLNENCYFTDIFECNQTDFLYDKISERILNDLTINKKSSAIIFHGNKFIKDSIISEDKKNIKKMVKEILNFFNKTKAQVKVFCNFFQFFEDKVHNLLTDNKKILALNNLYEAGKF